jgi:hypothetical protein
VRHQNLGALAAAAALLGLGDSMIGDGMGVHLHDPLPMPRGPKSAARMGRVRERGRHNPAGSKLARKAAEGKL